MDALGDDWIREKLANRLQSSSRALPRSLMSPSLSYGRQRGPWRSCSRHAAVLIAMYRDIDGQWTIPLTRRPETLKHHGGQVCLPGGQVERGESPLDAAVREFQEELGIHPKVVVHCGELDTQYVYKSDNRVHPVVAMIERPEEAWQADPTEVAEVISLPLAELMASASRGRLIKQGHVRKGDNSVGFFEFNAGTIQYQQHQIWGATAVILDQFIRVLLELGVKGQSALSN